MGRRAGINAMASTMASDMGGDVIVKQRMTDGTEQIRGLAKPSRKSWAVGLAAAEMAHTWNNKVPAGLGNLGGNMPLGITEVGQLACIKALHPAADIGPQRWPDKTADNTVVLQNTDTWLVPSSDPSVSTWDCCIWLTPFIDVPIIVTRHPGPGGIVDPNENMTTGNTATWPREATFLFFYSTPWDNGQHNHPGADYQTARITARSLTVNLVANATNNQGMVYAGQFSPNIKLMPEVGGPNFKSMANVVATLMHKLEVDADELNELDPEVGGSEILDYISDRMTKLNLDSTDGTVRAATLRDSPTGGQSGYRTVFQDWPFTAQQVVQMDPKNYVANADQGAYMTLRHASDVLEHTPTSTESYLSATVPHVTNSNTSEVNVLHSPGWTMGCILFQGLDGKASLNLKAITDLELTPRPDSQLAKFVEEAPPLDKIAIDHTRIAMGKLPSCFPADYNLLGQIVELIASALGSTNIPIVSSVAKGALAVNNATGGAGTRFLDGIF